MGVIALRGPAHLSHLTCRPFGPFAASLSFYLDLGHRKRLNLSEYQIAPRLSRARGRPGPPCPPGAPSPRGGDPLFLAVDETLAARRSRPPVGRREGAHQSPGRRRRL